MKGSISQQCHIPDCDGMRGRRSHSIRISRIMRMSACASDEAVVNLARRAAAVEASVGVMRLSSRGGNWGGGTQRHPQVHSGGWVRVQGQPAPSTRALALRGLGYEEREPQMARMFE